MLQFLHFDQLFSDVLPIMLEIFHIILTKLVYDTKVWDKKIRIYCSITDVSIDIVLHAARLSITKTVWQEWKKSFCWRRRWRWLNEQNDPYMLSTNVVGRPHVSSTRQAAWNTFRSCLILGKLLLQCMLDWVSCIIMPVYSTYYASIILKC